MNYIVFDLETGGLDKDVNPVCEIALLCLDRETLKEVGRYDSLIKPDYGLTVFDEKAVKSTGISYEMADQNGKPSKQVLKEVKDFFKEHKVSGRNGLPILCGHNIDEFDMDFMHKLFDSHSKKTATLFDYVSKSTLDSLTMSRASYVIDKDGNTYSHGLSVACEREGHEVIDAHRAMNDVEANADLLVSYIRKLRSITNTAIKNQKESFRDSFTFNF